MTVNDNETPKSRRDRLQLQAIARGMAEFLDRRAGLREGGIGFTLVLYDFGEKGNLAYASNGNREDMMSTLRELLEKMEIERAALLINKGGS